MNSKPAWETEQHPYSKLADALGVDRLTLTRRLMNAGHPKGGKATLRDAFNAWTAKADVDADRARRHKAEAESAEIDAAQKKGRLMLKSEHEAVVSELATQTRAKIQSAEYIPKEDRQRLTRELAEVKVKL